jgi:hypothetical protein
MEDKIKMARTNINILIISPIPVLRIRIQRIHMFLGLLDPDPDPLVRCMDPDPDPTPDPNPSIIKQNSKKTLKDPDPHPNPLVRGMDPRIRIHTKMSWIRNTAQFCNLMMAFATSVVLTGSAAGQMNVVFPCSPVTFLMFDLCFVQRIGGALRGQPSLQGAAGTV